MNQTEKDMRDSFIYQLSDHLYDLEYGLLQLPMDDGDRRDGFENLVRKILRMRD